MKKLICLLTLLFITSIQAFAGCEDGEQMSESAVINGMAKKHPAAKRECSANTVNIKEINDGEINTVKLICRGRTVGYYDVRLHEVEDAVCYVKQIRKRS